MKIDLDEYTLVQLKMQQVVFQVKNQVYLAESCYCRFMKTIKIIKLIEYAIANTVMIIESLLERIYLWMIENYLITAVIMENQMFIVSSFAVAAFEGQIMNANAPAAFKLAITTITAVVTVIASSQTHLRMDDQILEKTYV